MTEAIDLQARRKAKAALDKAAALVTQGAIFDPAAVDVSLPGKRSYPHLAVTGALSFDVTGPIGLGELQVTLGLAETQTLAWADDKFVSAYGGALPTSLNAGTYKLAMFGSPGELDPGGLGGPARVVVAIPGGHPFAGLESVNEATFAGRALGAGTGPMTSLSQTQARDVLGVASTTARGLVQARDNQSVITTLDPTTGNVQVWDADGVMKLITLVNLLKPRISVKGANYPLVAADNNTILYFTAAATLTWPNLGDFHCTVLATGGIVTVDGTGGTNKAIPDEQAATLIQANGVQNVFLSAARTVVS